MNTRPLVARGYLGAWIIILGTTLLGVGSHQRLLNLEYTPLLGLSADPLDQLGVNYLVYHYAAEAFLAGEDIYTAPPPDWSEFYTFLYPPSTVLIWVPGTVLDPMTGYAVHTIGTAVASLLAAWVIARILDTADVTIGWLDILFVGAFFFAGIHSTGTLLFGNINIFLGAFIAGGILALVYDRHWIAGAAFGAAALFKVIPTLIGLYLLRIRSWQAVGGALIVGGGGLVSSALLFGPRSVYRFFTEVLLPRSDTATFVGGYPPDETYYVTIQRPLSHLIWEGLLPRLTLWSTAPAEILTPAAVLTLLPALAYSYVGLDTIVDRLVALHVTLTAVVITLPSLRWYLAFLFPTWIGLLYVWGGGPTSPNRARVLAGGGLVLAIYWLAESLIWQHWLLLVGLAGVCVGLVYAWYESAVGTAFFFGGVFAALAERPSDMIARISELPAPLDTVITPLAGIASMQLLGLLLMLGACLGYKYRQGVGKTDLVAAFRQVPDVAAAELRRLPWRGERR